MQSFLAQHPPIDAPDVRDTGHALVVKVQGAEVWRVKYGAVHFGSRFVDTLKNLNDRVGTMVHEPAHLASAAEVCRGESEKRARCEAEITRYEAADRNARVALARVSTFSMGDPMFSRTVFA